MRSFLKFFALLLAVATVSFAASLWISGRSESGPAVMVDRFRGDAKEYTPHTGVKKLTSEEASFAFHPPLSNEIRYYHARSGDIKSIDLRSASSPKKIATIAPRALSLSWSRDGDEVIAGHQDGYTHYNLATGTQKSLDVRIKRPVFSKSSNDVAYIFFQKDAEAGDVSIAGSDFDSYKNILQTRLKTWDLEWLESRKLSLLAITDASGLSSLFSLDTHTSQLLQLISGAQALEIVWSPNGQYVLYSKKVRKSQDLYVLSAQSGISRTLGISGTASKCVWGGDDETVFCAIPEAGGDDAFFKIDTTSPQLLEKLFAPDASGFVNARELTYVSSEHTLVFKNFKDGRLYALSLER